MLQISYKNGNYYEWWRKYTLKLKWNIFFNIWKINDKTLVTILVEKKLSPFNDLYTIKQIVEITWQTETQLEQIENIDAICLTFNILYLEDC